VSVAQLKSFSSSAVCVPWEDCVWAKDRPENPFKPTEDANCVEDVSAAGAVAGAADVELDPPPHPVNKKHRNATKDTNLIFISYGFKINNIHDLSIFSKEL
jgi:hypothetical protein